MRHRSYFSFWALAALLATGCGENRLSPTALESRLGNNPEPAAGNSVVLSAGSVNALGAAIAAAGPHGRVLVQAGIHVEQATVEIAFSITIEGEPGAIIETHSVTAPAFPATITPALHFQSAGKSRLEGVSLRPADGGSGNTAVLIENSHGTRIMNCDFERYQWTILVQASDNCEVSSNNVAALTTWQTGDIPEADGIIMINGKGSRAVGNTITGAIFGLWLCGQGGVARDNELSSNLAGILLCTVPAGSFDIDGTLVGAEISATGWQVVNNDAHDNNWGYLAIDNANNNLFSNNDARDNVLYDIELAGDSFRFGFLTPTSYENTVVVGAHHDLTVKDCGRDNRVEGVVLVDNNSDPCF